jgi:cell division protein ZapA (FtsZ GTPase activity inhibitor)
LREVSQGSASPPADRVAIIAAMNIADELFQLKRSHSEEFSSIEMRAQSLIRMLDESLSPAKREAVASSPKYGFSIAGSTIEYESSLPCS